MVERYSIKFPEWWWSNGCLSRPIFVQPDNSTEKKNSKNKNFFNVHLNDYTQVCYHCGNLKLKNKIPAGITSLSLGKEIVVDRRTLNSEGELNWPSDYLRSDILFGPVWRIDILGVHVNPKEMSAGILEDQLPVLTISIHYFNLIGPSITQVKLVCWK